ncbi:hypothetical protein CEXT_672171 [Caerostris extrusa]|uniref:Uncharacterized protein n=1 Tax=Caerostris extrusa TaxID=172846 RepID=A0AAV4NFA2_CAEEX|nr:hypothetical protein CEXT_672171 [Caerostris extrusa]
MIRTREVNICTKNRQLAVDFSTFWCQYRHHQRHKSNMGIIRRPYDHLKGMENMTYKSAINVVHRMSSPHFGIFPPIFHCRNGTNFLKDFYILLKSKNVLLLGSSNHIHPIHTYLSKPSARVDPHLLKKSRTHECRPYRASNREHGSNRSTDPSIESRLAIGKEGFGNPPSTPANPLTLLKCADGRLSEQQKNHSSN